MNKNGTFIWFIYTHINNIEQYFNIVYFPLKIWLLAHFEISKNIFFYKATFAPENFPEHINTLFLEVNTKLNAVMYIRAHPSHYVPHFLHPLKPDFLNSTGYGKRSTFMQKVVYVTG